jgi:hypothetical protein
MRTRVALAIALFTLLVGGICVPTLSPRTAAAETEEAVARPAWQIGDRWVFKWKAGTEAGEHTNIIEEVTDTGVTIRSGDQFWYYTPDGELLSVVKNDVVLQQYSPSLPLLQFPLKPRMSWQQGERQELSREGWVDRYGADPSLKGGFRVHSC